MEAITREEVIKKLKGINAEFWNEVVNNRSVSSISYIEDRGLKEKIQEFFIKNNQEKK